MSASTKYSYTVLRYVHDTMTGEFVNVGVALHAPEAGYLSAICRTTYRRVSAAFPGLKGEHFSRNRPSPRRNRRLWRLRRARPIASLTCHHCHHQNRPRGW